MDPGLDFSSLLGLAEHVSKDKSTNEVRLLKTKFSGPKKEKKKQEGKLSANVQKFLAKKEQEEKEKERAKQQQLKNLQELRSDRAKNKIRKHLKVTKSSNKSVIREAENKRDTAHTLSGRKQCDEDDYGFASNESNKMYEKIMGKYESIPEPDPMSKFSKAKPKTHVDISSAMERVKQALRQEEEPVKAPRSRKRKHGDGPRREEDDEEGINYKVDRRPEGQERHRDRDQDRHRDEKSSKDKDAPKSKREREREKEEAIARRRQQAKNAPKALDFQSLMQMANTVKDKPVQLDKPKKEVKEADFGGRPMTKKEKEEYIRENEARLRREGKLPPKKTTPPPSQPPKKLQQNDKKDDRSKPENDRQKIAKIRKPEPGPQLHAAVKKSLAPPPPGRKSETGKHSELNLKNGRKESEEYSKMAVEYKQMQERMKEMEERLKLQEETRKMQEKMREMEAKLAKSAKSSSSSSSSAAADKPRKPETSNGGRKHEDRKSSDSRKRDYRDVQPRHFPGEKVRKNKSSSSLKRPRQQRIESDSEYDSEMDDFIDDGDTGGFDISKEIKSIFGYDRNRYRDEPYFDDRSMENNRYSSIMQEEVRSAKIGRQEDLEDMRREEEEKKRKKKRR